jgi:predicted transglutaminase-like protease
LLEKTVSNYKKSHALIVAPSSEDDLSMLFIRGENKLNLEVEGVKNISGSKYLYPHAINGNSDSIDHDEMIEINYEERHFF